jgi:hypothetical protein
MARYVYTQIPDAHQHGRKECRHMTNNHANTRNTMSDLERAVYDMAEAGILDTTRARLYPRPIGKLERAGLLRRSADGQRWEAVRTGTMPPPAETPDPLVSLVTRVPQSWVDTLDAMGPTRSEAARMVIGKGLAAGSGLRKAVRAS